MTPINYPQDNYTTNANIKSWLYLWMQIAKQGDDHEPGESIRENDKEVGGKRRDKEGICMNGLNPKGQRGFAWRQKSDALEVAKGS